MTQAQVSNVLTPELRTALTTRTDLFLYHIVAANLKTQYASQTPSLALFRDAVEARGTAAVDATTLLRDFRDHVPVTDYESYKPWIVRFDESPCTEARVNDLLAPGLPYFIAMSSSTSGTEPKLFPVYEHAPIGDRPAFPVDMRGPTAWIFYCGYRRISKVEREPGQVVKQMPLCLATSGRQRMSFGWGIENDKSRLSTIMPTQVAPWGANMISHNRSFLMIHALFCLACRDLRQIFLTFPAYFLNLVHHIDEEWDMFLTCIRDGKVPNLDGISHLRDRLQVAFSADPARADELAEIGPPSSGDGWVARAWPRLTRLGSVCSGPFGTCLPQVRAILGPTAALLNLGYASSESFLGVFFDPNDLETFVFETDDVVEFIAAGAEGKCSDILQGWELEAGRRYQIVVTTRNGLWRYLLDDIIEIVGFHSQNGSPVFKYFGRTTSVIRLPCVALPDAELVAAIQAISSEEYIQVLDFTAVLDEREAPQTVGFIVEISGQLGPNAHKTAQRLFEVLGAGNDIFQNLAENGKARPPTIRIVEPGTFMDYRRWRCEKMNIGLGQVKIPIIMTHAESQEWILKRVTQEL